MRPIHRSRQGFTLIELLVVISIIAILAGMLFPAISIVRRNANAADCGNNLKGIFTACIAYQQDYGGWPISMTTTPPPPPANPFTTPGDAKSAADDVNRAFELLAATQDLPNKLFHCKSAGGSGPIQQPMKNNYSTTWAGVASYPALTTNPSYAFDYSAPGDASSIRVMLADRECHNHQNNVMAVFGDSHITKLKATAQAGTGNPTFGITPNYVVFNPSSKGADGHDEDATPDATEDNIYDFNGDYVAGGTAPTGFGLNEGSTRRCFLK